MRKPCSSPQAEALVHLPEEALIHLPEEAMDHLPEEEGDTWEEGGYLYLVPKSSLTLDLSKGVLFIV
jgi:hypothetical protein